MRKFVINLRLKITKKTKETKIMNFFKAFLNKILFYQSLAKIGQKGLLNERKKKYYQAQLKQTINKKDKNASFRYQLLVNQFIKKVNVDYQWRVLCVGCRNAKEIDYWQFQGFRNTTGIDLFSSDSRIKIMDMEKMEFSDSSFDVLYAADSFEHAFNQKKAAQEFLRVIKNDGFLIISVPGNFTPSEIDRCSFDNFSDLYYFFQPHIKKIYFQKKITDKTNENSLMTIFSIHHLL